MGRKASPNKNDFSTQIEEQEKNIALLKKEIHIEAALEKVRARTMAMQKTEELPQIINILFQQLQELSFDIYASSLVLINERMSQELWIAGYSKDILPQSYEIYYTDHLYFTHFIEAWQNGISYDFLKYEGQKKKDYDQYVFFKTGMSTLPEESKAEIMNIEKTFICAAYMKYGWIEINAEEGLPTDQANILQRFAKVFEQIYTRFLDLKKAEAQTREAEIQLAIERVRARTMAMHRSEELGEVAILLYKEFNTLKMGDFFNCGFVIVNEADSVQNGWMTQPEGDFIEELDLPYPGDSIFKERLNAWSEGNGVFCQKVAGEKLAEHIKYVSDRSISKNQISAILPYMPDPCYFYCGNFKEGYLHIVAKEELVPEAEAILARFTKVFSQTYTRFLDLQKAEEQAREARIETALEKIRSNMMAMHQSDQLRQVVATMFEQLQNLGFDSSASVIHIYNDDLSAEQWMAGFSHGELPKSYHIPYCDHPYFTEEVSGWQDGLPFHELIFEGPQKVEYAKWMIEHSDYQFLPAEFHQEMLSPERIYISNAHMKYGLVEVWGAEPLPKKSINTLIRFAKVFEQTYTRFLDLQKAEEQAREAQIEASMERVRARAMAMHTTGELNELVALIYDEIQKLGLFDYGCSIIICDEANKVLQFWYAEINQLQSFRCYNVPITSQSIVQEQYQSWKKGLTQFDIEIRGKEHKEYIEFLLTETDHKELPEEVKEGWRSFSEVFFTYSNFKYGLLEFVDVKPIDKNNYPIYQRFAKVFEQTYTRFLDLQKAEKQAKEAQIETALEKVRSRTMAMHSSQELGEAVDTLLKQFKILGFDAISSWVSLMNPEENTIEFWTKHEEKLVAGQTVHISELINFEKEMESWKKGEESIHLSMPFKLAKLELKKIFGIELVGAVSDTFYLLQLRHKYGFLGLGTLKESNEEIRQTVQRFAKVFEQTYTRFLDLKKAEAQAREAQIEAALERVRSRSMAMQKSDELKELVHTLSNEIGKLDIIFNRAFICIYDTKTLGSTWWMRNPESNESFGLFIKYHELLPYQAHLKAWRERKTKWQYILKEEDKKEWDKFLFNETEFSLLPEHIKNTMRGKKKLYLSTSFSNFGYLALESSDSLSDEQFEILSRFAKVFDLTYTRFLDLQKAEAQAREAEIELALERVRAKTMAMQKSDELSDVAALLFKQIKILGAKLWTISIAFCKEDELIVEKWGGSPITDQIFAPNFIPYNADHGEQSMYDTWKNKVEIYSYVQEGKVLKDIYDHLMTIPSFKANFQKVIDAGRPLPVWQKNHVVSFKYGYLLVITEEEFKEEYVFTRFAKVFEQTYTRFLDLQKAETQAREAQIEAALERVRSRSMAMYNSEELIQVATVLHDEINTLAILPASSVSLIIVDEEKLKQRFWGSKSATGFLQQIDLPLLGDTILKKRYEAWKRKEPLFSQKIKGEQLRKHLEIVLPANTATKKVSESKILMPDPAYFYFANFSYGAIQLLNAAPIDDETTSLLLRFAKVFEQTYTRFLDLQKAEEQAKEALKQSSLDRVRGEIASMRSTADLERITPLVWNELTTLGVPFIRCGVSIIHEETQDIEMFLSTPNGESLAMMNLDYTSSDLTQNSIDHWRKNKVYHQHWSKEEFVSWTKTLMERGQISNDKAYQGSEAPPETLELYFVPFTQGSLYVGAIEELSDEEIEMVKALAKAFSIAYARYEDFVKLEKAKDSIEATLAELKNTQKQLIQSEKMASLGELTAGIAHEIQNPLNFVNNFSEVSSELVEEIKETRIKSQETRPRTEEDEIEDEILEDIKQNLEKINHHGKRADAIVKGMLEHSRTSTGEKVQTDINALADEYLRLSYHGLRAKDNIFNADFETDFDPNLPKVELVAQDIGRVLLNLINNAFYAVNERKKNGEAGYKSIVSVSTKKLDGKILISVKDNGPGIPPSIKDKIFQPFFTTKPTGQGTGLGLSLSYDIVKAHGGEIRVESLPAGQAGTEFTIELPI
jgi:signal transduction histidine kinase